MAAEEEDVVVPWEHSEAKKLLTVDAKARIVGSADQGLHPCQVYVMRPEYADYPCESFAKWLCALRVRFDELHHLANVDSSALANDLSMGLRKNSRPCPRWKGSDAETLLQQDLDDGLDLDMSPQDLLASRPECAPWVGHPKVFRDHIHQELRARRERPCWLARRAEKEAKNAKKALEKAKKEQQKKSKQRTRWPLLAATTEALALPMATSAPFPASAVCSDMVEKLFLLLPEGCLANARSCLANARGNCQIARSESGNCQMRENPS